VSFCVAVDETGQALTSVDPGGGPGAWHVAPGVDRGGLTSVSCASATLCVAGGGDGTVAASVNPASGAAVWRVSSLAPGEIDSVSCVSPSLCVAVDRTGLAFTSTDPGGGRWAEVRLASLGDAAHQFVSCGTPQLCVIVTTTGKAFVSTNPTEGAASWTPVSLSGQLSGISCVASGGCVAIDQTGDVWSSADPSGGAAAWSAANIDGSQPLTAVSCASSKFCVALDQSGYALSSSSPMGGGGGWSGPAVVGDQLTPLRALSCPATNLCVADAGSGQVVTSVTPTAGASSWRVTSVDPASYLQSVSCPTAGLCAAVDGIGNVLTSTDPASDSSSWASTDIEPGNPAPPRVNLVNGIACASPSLCAVVDANGQVVTSTDPTGGASAWNAAKIDTAALWGISCPTASLCVAGDASGNVLVSSDPTGGPGAWTTINVAGDHVVGQVVCPSASLCVADSDGALIVSSDPTGGADAWRPVGLSSLDSVSALTCPSTSLCVAFDASGRVITSTDPAGGPGAWAVGSVSGAVSTGDVSCPSAQLCFAFSVEPTGDSAVPVLMVSTDPAAGASSWSAMPVPYSVSSLACPSPTLCVGVAGGKDLAISTDPTAIPATALWQQDFLDQANTFVGLTCPSLSFCGAIDDAGRIFTSIDPSSARSSWSPTTVPALENGIAYGTSDVFASSGYGITCASLRLCIAYDTVPSPAGHFSSAVLAATTRPLGGADAWSVSETLGLGSPGLSALACPSAKLCVGVTEGGIQTSTHPTVSVSNWKTVLSPVEFPSTISCPAASLCVAGGYTGRIATSTTPTGDTKAWKVAHIDNAPPTDIQYLGRHASITDVVCPTTRLCVALDDGGNVLTSTNPTGGARAWKRGHLRLTAGLFDLNCPSAAMCVAIATNGDAVTTTNPTGGPSSWTLTPLDPLHQLTALACPTMSRCIAGDDAGDLFTGFGPKDLTRKAAATALSGMRLRSCPSISTVLHKRACSATITLPGASIVTINWRSGRNELATGSTASFKRRRVTVELDLTAAGARILHKSRHGLTIRVTTTLTDATGHNYSRTTRLVLAAP
jgi:hypothetical protein